ncbi:helix-turn-helix transcriptional regulator [Acetobacter farinalis]|uniref:Helix-turn-helix transcriptional regulator n=1 Tax=Acetobacter farinalis TaxID=1260984 RepID=A0ABT3Q7F1_9PROT|nr:helix-turn-helix transcriptional regulator [Acetobacter farinalis]MCX2561197.1 helix-turn-helix transcriptional regulator [Acetobacter farinalis]NHO29833.1 helix-turn-helix domain-containing protein [Acetobacter farinalis]
MILPPEQRRALGAFLRARRDALSPEDVGLHVLPGRRRAAGLRREEAAQICGISTTWYTWLEQGRDVSCSAATLARIATAMHLSPAERLYLFELAQLKDPNASRAFIASDLPESVRIFPDQVTVPCYVLDILWNACVANEAARKLFAGWLGGPERNLLRYIFLDPTARIFLDDWESSARRVLAEFRATGIQGNKVEREALVQELRHQSADFDRLWHNQSVLLREGGPRRFHHPIEGALNFDKTTLTFTTWPHYQLVTLKPR